MSGRSHRDVSGNSGRCQGEVRALHCTGTVQSVRHCWEEKTNPVMAGREGREGREGGKGGRAYIGN